MRRNINILGTIILLVALSGGSARAQSDSRYSMDQADSYLLAVTGKSGLFSFAAHNHALLASQWSASFQIEPENLARSSTKIILPVAAMVIDSDEARKLAKLGSGPGAEDRKKIQQRLLSPEILDPGRFPNIEFVSPSIRRAAADQLQLAGSFTLHGKTRLIEVPVHYQTSARGFVFTGSFTIRQSDYGMKPESVAGGSVKVKDEISIRFRVVAVREQP